MLKKSKILIYTWVIILSIYSFLPKTLYGKNESSLPYQIFCINDYYRGIFLVKADIDIRTKVLEIDYQPNLGDKLKSVDLNFGEVINDFTDIRLINSFKIEIEKLALNETFKINRYNISNFKKGMVLVLWVGNVYPSSSRFAPIEKKNILERTKAILWEQYRLVEISSNKGESDLLVEVSRNYEE